MVFQKSAIKGKCDSGVTCVRKEGAKLIIGENLAVEGFDQVFNVGAGGYIHKFRRLHDLERVSLTATKVPLAG